MNMCFVSLLNRIRSFVYCTVTHPQRPEDWITLFIFTCLYLKGRQKWGRPGERREHLSRRFEFLSSGGFVYKSQVSVFCSSIMSLNLLTRVKRKFPIPEKKEKYDKSGIWGQVELFKGGFFSLRATLSILIFASVLCYTLVKSFLIFRGLTKLAKNRAQVMSVPWHIRLIRIIRGNLKTCG